MKISVITLFPEQLKNALSYSILKRAQEKGIVEFNIIDHRKFGQGTHKTVDDRPYGGGAGMVLKIDVLKKAIDSARLNISGEKVILLDPQGEKYTQTIAENLTAYSHLILVCGHYEGFDERIREFIDMEISLGDFVLTGGEIPAIAIIDSVTRLLPNVLKDPSATKNESFSEKDGQRLLEGPQYTRPEVFEGLKVPEVFLSGDPKKIEEFKKSKALETTKLKRDDLLTPKTEEE